MPPNTLPLKLAYMFGASKGFEKEISEIRSLVIEWDSSYDSSLRRGYIVELFERNEIYEEFKALHWSHGNTPGGQTFRKRFLNIKRRYEDFLAGTASEPMDNIEEDIDDMDDQQFAAEADLRDFLAKNPERIEKSMTVYA